MKAIIISVIMIPLLCSCRIRQVEHPAQQPVAVQKYDWTGKYVYQDAKNDLHLILHRRTVDGSYEMKFFPGEVAAHPEYAEYMFDAKDAEKSICIRFMGSFTVDEKKWPYQKGDTLFILSMQGDSAIITDWRTVRTVDPSGSFQRTSKNFN